MALARALAAGESQAFERFVEHFRSKIFHYSWLMCGQPDDAEEVAQDTFLRAYRALGTYSQERLRGLKEKAWLHRIAVNVVKLPELLPRKR